MSNDLVSQTKNAFEFIQKLHLEISYFIKEVEARLQQEPEVFVIARPFGYAVTTRTSAGLESKNVSDWMPKTFTVFFIPEEKTLIQRGQTVTRVDENLRVLALHVEPYENSVPRVLVGYIENIKAKRQTSKTEKFESTLAVFAYHPLKIFASLPIVHYEDADWSFDGNFIERRLFSINGGSDVESLLADVLKLYRKGLG